MSVLSLEDEVAFAMLCILESAEIQLLVTSLTIT